MEYLGDFNTSTTVRGMWNSNAVAGASVTRATNGSIRIYKNNSTTERTSASGITDTEDFDSLTGVHHVNIDLSDNTDSGFYAAGNDYFVVLSAATIDGQTINAYLFCFSIENRNIKANVTQFNGTNGTFSSGRPEVNTTHVAGTSQTARDLGASVLISSGTGTGQLSVSSGVIQADIAKCGGSTVAAGALPNVAAGSTGGLILIGTGTRDINPNAGGVVITATGMDDVAAHVWDLAYASHNTSGTFGYQVQNIATGTPPTAAAIASQVRTELTTELGRIDVATSTRLAPTTAGRTLDVSTTGEAGLDFDNIKDATGAHTLTNITIPNVTTAVNVTNNNDKTGYTLIQAFPTNFADLAITSSTGEVTVGTLANNVITTASINDGAITDGKFTVPSLSAPATGILGFITQLWRRNFKKTTFDSATGLLKTFADDGSTVVTTETCTEVSNVQTKGAAS